MSFYVTTPIYYVNAQPHLGHAYTTIATDVLARHMRQRGEDVFFLTGTDEHGEPVADAARAQGLEPRELADRNAERFKSLMPVLDVSNDFFIRTSDLEHATRVQYILQRVHDNGWVYKGVYEGWYCPRCADFKVENEILEGNRCPIHEIPLTRESEENWFFRLSTFQEPLERLYAEQPDFVMPPRHYNEAHSFITSALQDVSLSRARLRWGWTRFACATTRSSPTSTAISPAARSRWCSGIATASCPPATATASSTPSSRACLRRSRR